MALPAALRKHERAGDAVDVTPATVTVIIPTHAARLRTGALQRALASIWRQTRLPDAVVVTCDVDRLGAGPTRQRALAGATTDWVAFLDSDDELLPYHLQHLLGVAAQTSADVVYPACRVLDPRGRPLPPRDEWGRPGREFDAAELRRRSYIPVTSLVRTETARRSRFAPPAGSDYDDWGFYLGLLDAGARFVHTPAITWLWHHHGENTSGRPDRGDAADE